MKKMMIPCTFAEGGGSDGKVVDLLTLWMKPKKLQMAEKKSMAAMMCYRHCLVPFNHS